MSLLLSKTTAAIGHFVNEHSGKSNTFNIFISTKVVKNATF